MAQLVRRYRGMSLFQRGDAFAINWRASIVGQQISVKAADSVWARFAERVGTVTPKRSCGQGRRASRAADCRPARPSIWSISPVIRRRAHRAGALA